MGYNEEKIGGKKMNQYEIRRADRVDLDRIMEIYDYARAFMVRSGNPTQWRDGYPGRDILEADIDKECLFVVTNRDEIRGVFYFVIGDDPTYGYMENGCWRSDDPYGTIHRVAGDGSGGIFAACLKFCKGQISHIRIDTHRDNKPMQYVLEKHGFSPRGIIYVGDGTARIAYDSL